MGMFNVLNINCPHCNELLDLESKEAFPNELIAYNKDNVDCRMALDLRNEKRNCFKCGQTFIIKAEIKTTLTIEKLDFDEYAFDDTEPSGIKYQTLEEYNGTADNQTA